MNTILLSLLALQLQVASLTLDNMKTPTAYAAVLTAQDYFDYASSTAISLGVDPIQFTQTLKCESSFDPNAIGDHGTSFGIAQIHLPAHKDVSRERALDGIWSIDWAAHQFSIGNAKIWSCYKKMFG